MRRGARSAIVLIVATAWLVISTPVASAAPTAAPATPTAGARNAAGVDPLPDWIFAKVEASVPTRIRSAFRVRGHWTGPGPLVMGVGLASRGGPFEFSGVDVRRLGGGRTTVSLAAGTSHRRLDFAVNYHGTVDAQPLYIDDQTASTIGVVFFLVNGAIDDVLWEPQSVGFAAPDVSSSVRSGRGAQALMVGSPTGGGATVAAAGLGAGLAYYRDTVPTGLVGAMEWISCQACSGTWAPPGGPRHRWVQARNYAWPACWCGSDVGADTAFAGPAGAWRWSWSGVSAPSPDFAALDLAGAEAFGGPTYALAEPVAAAWAPIGNDWKLFDTCNPSDGCQRLPVAVQRAVTRQDLTANSSHVAAAAGTW